MVDKKAAAEEVDEFGLGVAQIVITAATPMEEIEHPFPGEEAEGGKSVEKKSTTEDKSSSVENGSKEKDAEVGAIEEKEAAAQPEEVKSAVDEVEEKSTVDDLPADSAPFPISSSSGSEADSTSGPSTADNSQSLPSRNTVIEMQQPLEEQPDIIPEKMLIGGRASIPDELQPDQLEKLQNLKESNA